MIEKIKENKKRDENGQTEMTWDIQYIERKMRIIVH